MTSHPCHRFIPPPHFQWRAFLPTAAILCLWMFSANAPAQSVRPYQMTVHAPTNDVTNAGVDIPMFTRGIFTEQVQPPGRSIVWLPSTNADLDQYGIDWSRIVAVYVDEPYIRYIDANSTSCTNSAIPTTKAMLIAISNAMRARAPSARFWVNFSEREILADLENPACSLNESYIDVISTDIYHVDFAPTVSNIYANVFYLNRPTDYQQLALIVPTFVAGTPSKSGRSPQTPAQAIARLTQYLNFAALLNQTCDLPLGLTGDTGIYDRCPVWLVSGFTSGSIPPGDDTAILPLDHPASADVMTAWWQKLSVQRIDPTQVRKVLKVLPTWLNE